MYKPFTYLVVTYFQTYLPIYETYFLQNWLPRWNQILTQLSFIHNWVLTGIQWMVHWWVLVHCGPFKVLVYPPSSLIKQGAYHTVALPFTLKSILRRKKNYENSNISPCKNIIFKSFLSKSFKIPQLITISQVSTQAKISSFKFLVQK